MLFAAFCGQCTTKSAALEHEKESDTLAKLEIMENRSRKL